VKVELPVFSPGAESPASDDPEIDNFEKLEEPENIYGTLPTRYFFFSEFSL